jgi:RimJ/RimL family protein N-acetyltransferase
MEITDLAKAYRIETERCVIRCYQPEDVVRLHDAIRVSADHLRPWLPFMAQEPKDLDARAAMIRQFRGKFDLGMDYVFGIFDKSEQNLVGSTGLHTRVGKNAREIGYWVHARYAGKGYTTEVVSALTRVGFVIEKLSRIEIRVDPRNVKSRRIPLKLGYTMEEIISDESFGEKRDLMIWTMSKIQFEHSPLRKTTLRAFDFQGKEIAMKEMAD